MPRFARLENGTARHVGRVAPAAPVTVAGENDMLGGLFGWISGFLGYIIAFVLGVNWPFGF